MRMSDSGDAGVVFWVEISRNVWSDSMITRDLVDVLWFGIDVLRDLCLWIVYKWFGTQSLKHLALDWTFGEYGTLIREKVLCRRCRVWCFYD